MSFSYDTAGNLTSATDAAGKTTSYTYNSHGLPTSVTLPDPDGAGPLSAAVTSLAYDSYARLTTLTNPDSSTRTLGYNAADNITSDTDELAHAASFTYDALGRLTRETDRAVPKPRIPTTPSTLCRTHSGVPALAEIVTDRGKRDPASLSHPTATTATTAMLG